VADHDHAAVAGEGQVGEPAAHQQAAHAASLHARRDRHRRQPDRHPHRAVVLDLHRREQDVADHALALAGDQRAGDHATST
jgi:hypothetical protein